MNSVRKGNDIRVCWAIYCAGQPYDLTGRDLRLVLTDRMGNARELDDYAVDGNVIRWTFEGRRQTTLGRYHLTLIENPGLPGMVTVDSVDFCELVPRAPLSHTGEEECSNLDVEAVTLQSDINLGAEEVLNEVGESVQRIAQEAASNVEAMGTLIVSATGQIEEEAERLHAVVSDARTATEQAKTFTNTATQAVNIVTGSANSLTPIVEELSGVARQTQTNCRNLAEVVMDLNSATFSARAAAGNSQSAAASLSNLVGEWEQGKRQIVEALQAQGEEASVNDTFSALASKVVGIHKAVDGEEAAVTPAFFGSDSVDLLSVMHNHRRADMPYMCGAKFGQSTITLSGADAYLCSDGHFSTEGGEYTFTDMQSERWVIWYFTNERYTTPAYPANTIEMIVLNGKPTLSVLTAPINRYLCFAEEATLANSGDTAFIQNAYSLVTILGGVKNVQGCITKQPAATMPRTIILPDAKTITSKVFYSDTNIERIILPSLKRYEATEVIGYSAGNVEEVVVPHLEFFSGGALVFASLKLKILTLPSLTTMAQGRLLQRCTALQRIDLPELLTCDAEITNGDVGQALEIFCPKLFSLGGYANLLASLSSNSEIHLYLPSLTDVGSTAYFLGQGASNANARVYVHLGNQHTPNQLRLGNSTTGVSRTLIKDITVEPGFRAGLNLTYNFGIEPTTIGNIINNLGDNTGAETLSIAINQNRATAMRQHYGDEAYETLMAIASAKNYSIQIVNI